MGTTTRPSKVIEFAKHVSEASIEKGKMTPERVKSTLEKVGKTVEWTKGSIASAQKDDLLGSKKAEELLKRLEEAKKVLDKVRGMDLAKMGELELKDAYREIVKADIGIMEVERDLIS